MEQVIYNGEVINYEVIRKRNKNLYARMDKYGNLVMTVPYLVSKRTIEKFAIESYFKLKKKMQNKQDKKINNNGIITILGVCYKQDEIEDINYLLLIKLKEFIRDNYEKICGSMGIMSIPTLKFKRVKGYLGEYNKKTHSINLNILIGHLDEECVRYVIIHELCHIRHMNHQEGFWREVARYCPNYLKLRRKCKKEFVYYENY